jgi:hypothetical protein
MLTILQISENDIEILDEHTIYDILYVSTSYTHDVDSNLPPREEIYQLYKDIVDIVKLKNDKIETPKKIYISRRSWVHGDLSNIGTNYTSRRKLINEDQLVDTLEKKGYIEVFTETMSTEEKILLFSNVEKVVGAIGGGLCNVLFSPKDTELITLVSPFFLKVNKRFIYSINQVKLTLFDDVEHFESTEFKKFMRVKFDNKIGEIVQTDNNEVTIMYSNNNVTGWNNEVIYNYTTKKINEIEKLDEGLNSEWIIKLDKFKKLKW